MNSPPTPPYCGSVAAALHLMNLQIRCGSCREKVYGVFYKLRDKKRSKESAYFFSLILRTPLIPVYRLAMDATRRGDFQKAAILFKAINRNKPFNGSAMNSPPTPPYYGSVAAALHLMNSQCGSCREKVYFCLSPCDGCNPTGG